MKKNLIKSLTLSTATLAAFSLANTVLADETTTISTPEQASQVNTTSSQELEKQVAQAETTTTTAKSNLEQSQQVLAQEEKALAEAQAQATSAQTDADTAADNLAKASETAKQATDENIASAQKDIDTASTTVAQATNQVDAAEKSQKQAQDTYTQQADQVANAQSNLDAKTATYQATQETINNTQEQEDQAKAQLQKDLSTSQTEVTDLENKISTYSGQLDSAKTELDALKNSVNVDELWDTTVEKQGVLNKAEKQYDKTKARAEKILNTESTLTVTTQTPAVLAEQNKHPEMSATIYSGERTETIYLTAEQAKEYAEKGTITYVPNSTKITEYFVAYLNELKRLNGITSTVNASNSDLIAYAVARAEENAARGMVTHQTDIDATDFNLLDTGNMDSVKPIVGPENAAGGYGNLSYDSNSYLDVNYTYLSDQAVAYNLLLGWFTDYNNIVRTETSSENVNYGHRLGELSAAGPISIGFSADGTQATLERVFNFDSNNVDTSLFIPDFITNDKGETVMVRQGTETPVVFLPAVTFNFVYDKDVLGQETTDAVDAILKSALNESQANITSKQTALSEVNSAADKARAVYVFALKNQANLAEKTAEKETEISSLETNLKTAQTNLSTAKTKVAQTQEKLTQLEQNSQLASLKDQLASQEKAVQEAQANLDTQKAELNQRQTALTQATSLTETAKQDLANAQVQLETAKTNYQALITSQENLTSAQKADQEAKSKLAQVKTELEAAKSKLTQSQKEVAEAQLAYDTAKANYDKLLADYKVAKDLEDKAKDNTISTLPDGTIIAVPKDSPSTDKPSLDIDKIKDITKPSETEKTEPTKPTVDNKPSVDNKPTADNRPELDEPKDSEQAKPSKPENTEKTDSPQVITPAKPQAPQAPTAKQVQTAHKASLTQQESQKVLERRGTSAHYTPQLPTTGEDNSITYVLAGLALIGSGLVFWKRKEN